MYNTDSLQHSEGNYNWRHKIKPASARKFFIDTCYFYGSQWDGAGHINNLHLVLKYQITKWYQPSGKHVYLFKVHFKHFPLSIIFNILRQFIKFVKGWGDTEN